MYGVANTRKLTDDGIINSDQAKEIELRARETMIALAINSVLCFGILSATGGLIFWLADPLSVAICGLLFLGGGLAVLALNLLINMRIFPAQRCWLSARL